MHGKCIKTLDENSIEHSGIFLKERLLKPARDVRKILDWGYPKFATIKFVADHFQLDAEERHILTRVIIAPGKIVSRNNKRVSCEALKGRDLFLDGYNVLLTVDSLLKKELMWFCDDGYIRDTRYYFRRAKQAEGIEEALNLVLAFLSETAPKTVIFLFDAQISKSGELAGLVRHKLGEYRLSGEARISKTTDFELKAEGGRSEKNLIVATTDGIIIDSVLQVLDIPACLMEKMGIESLKLY